MKLILTETLSGKYKSAEIEKCTKEDFIEEINLGKNDDNFTLFDFTHFKYDRINDLVEEYGFHYEVYYFEEINEEMYRIIKEYMN